MDKLVRAKAESFGIRASQLLTFPKHQTNQYRDEAHWDDGESHHQACGGVLKQIFSFCLCAVLEIDGVDVDEEVLDVRIRKKAASNIGQCLQTLRQIIVRPAPDKKEINVLELLYKQ